MQRKVSFGDLANFAGKILSSIWRLPSLMFIGMVRVYQIAISPLLPATCRFQPTCSAYAIEALQKYGFIVGGCKTAWRLVRCTPLCKGGHDPP